MDHINAPAVIGRVVINQVILNDLIPIPYVDAATTIPIATATDLVMMDRVPFDGHSPIQYVYAASATAWRQAAIVVSCDILTYLIVPDGRRATVDIDSTAAVVSVTSVGRVAINPIVRYG